MKREEEIRQASIEYTICNRPMCIGGGAFSKVVDEMNRNPAFEAGAKWADETIIDKAVNWLVHNMASGEYLGLHGTIIKPDFITKFKKAMKGE